MRPEFEIGLIEFKKLGEPEKRLLEELALDKLKKFEGNFEDAIENGAMRLSTINRYAIGKMIKGFRNEKDKIDDIKKAIKACSHSDTISDFLACVKTFSDTQFIPEAIIEDILTEFEETIRNARAFKWEPEAIIEISEELAKEIEKYFR